MLRFSPNIFIVLAVFLITIFFLLPILFQGGISHNSISELLFSSSSGFCASLKRTMLFALTSSIINAAGGFFLALTLSKIQLKSIMGKLISLLILPLTFGNMATVFVFKVTLFNTDFFNRIVQGGSFTQTLFLLFIQFWQFGFLFAYLFWLNIQKIPKQLKDYSFVSRLSFFEKVRDIILPQVRNLFILFLLIGFVFSFYEDTKNQFIFKASQGQGTELINHWIQRSYESTLNINPNYANQSTFTISLLVFASAVFTFLALSLGAFIIMRCFSKIKVINNHNSQEKTTKKQKSIPFFVVISSFIAILAPIITSLLRSQYNFADNLSSIAPTFFLTFIPALAATIFAVSFGASSRLAFPKLLNDFNSKSLLYFLAIFSLQIIPPICIVLCGFMWFSCFKDNLIYFVWIMGHCILTLPILGSFVLATHFSVKGNELDYLTAYNISKMNIMKYSFLKRFKAEYLLTFLFAFTFIWNDAGLNKAFSDKIPSFATNLQMLLIGRAADYSKATSFLLVSILLSLSCICIWNYIIRKAEKSNKTV